ncbi:MAG: hypothetical protein ABSE99_01110 [Terracidiphilus sp.]|jgi:hypothetical protein
MMLWYKAWLETRWRFAFLVGSILLVWIAPLWLPSTGVTPGMIASRMWVALQLESVLLSILAAIYLAGAGINTQTMYSATSGFHGSMLFTLSLPVSRARLLVARAGLGALETCGLVVLMAGYMLFLKPGAVSALQAFDYMVRAVVCAMAVYALSVLLACVLDEMWQFTGACILWVGFFLLQSKVNMVSQISPLRGMSLNCYPLTAPMPWAPVVASAVLAGVLLYASVLVLQRKEY